MEQNILSHTFTFKKTMTFTIPTMIMMIFISLYQMVDGVFVSNIVGDLALTSLNVVYPYISVILAIGIMLASGVGVFTYIHFL